MRGAASIHELYRQVCEAIWDEIETISCTGWTTFKSHKGQPCEAYLKWKNLDVTVVQENHLTESKIMKWDSVGNIVGSCYWSKRSAVALFKNHLNIIWLIQCQDDQGRVICVETMLYGVKMNFCHIYVPNVGDPISFQKLNNNIFNVVDGYVSRGFPSNVGWVHHG